jgi:hypothetical protein
MGCRLGMWVSPSSGYAPGLDNSWLAAEGYEMTTVSDEGEQVACFALGGRYQREFTDNIVGYAKEYGLGHVIFDGLVPSCGQPEHLHDTGVGSVYSIAAGFKDVMNQLRRINPQIVLEPLSCGHPPSPWWNVHTPFLLGPAGDDVPFGRVPCPDWTESLISARDVAYRASQEKWIVRTQALETFDIIMQSPGVFQNMAAMAVGRGRWFVSANIRPELMSGTDWDFLAALIRWERANERYLVDARMFGGNPADREAYGYHFHHAEKDIYCIRNPWIEERRIRLPARVREVRDVQMIYPRRAAAGRIEPGADGPTIVLAPYETVFLETVSPADDSVPPVAVESPHAHFVAGDPEMTENGRENGGGFAYRWSGSIDVPDLTNAELCILVEGATDVVGAQGAVRVDGRPVNPVRKNSAGQFGAAVSSSPENWSWFIVPLTPGEHQFNLSLSVPLEKASVGVYLRGATTATSDEAPEGVAAFPVYQPNQRAWSQTLQPLKAFTTSAAERESDGI